MWPELTPNIVLISTQEKSAEPYACLMKKEDITCFSNQRSVNFLLTHKMLIPTTTIPIRAESHLAKEKHQRLDNKKVGIRYGLEINH